MKVAITIDVPDDAFRMLAHHRDRCGQKVPREEMAHYIQSNVDGCLDSGRCHSFETENEWQEFSGCKRCNP